MNDEVLSSRIAAGAAAMKIEDVISRLDRVRRSGNGYSAKCPAHQDKNNSLSVNPGNGGRILFKCFAGCEFNEIIGALGLEPKDLSGACRGTRRYGCETVKRPPKSLKNKTSHQKPQSVKDGQNCETLTLAILAAAKKIPEKFLASLGLRNSRIGVSIPYLDESGAETAIRYRLALSGDSRFRWRSGAKVSLYGLQRLDDIHRAGFALIVEGESDCWTAWHYDLPCVGVPGKANWRKEWAKHFKGIDVFVWQEPDAEDFSQRIGKDLPDARVIVAPEGVKDISDAHVASKDVAALIVELKATAVPIADLLRQQQSYDLRELIAAAKPVLEAPDPLEVVRNELQRLGYGGDLKPALITYLAMATRLLKLRRGTMPAHLLLVGPPSVGKSYTVQLVMLLLPPEASHVIDAGSPRVLIYDDADLQHRVVLFSEADSLPAGEDNPAASAIRNLLQDHSLHYQVVVRDPESGDFAVREISKPGPTVLVTTSTRFLRGQMGSRVFTLDVPNDATRLRDALKSQAQREIADEPEPDTSLIAFQAVLQRMAPIDVVVPFAPDLAEFIAGAVNAPRILRDYQRLLSLIKAVTILRYKHRSRADDGRLIATIEDYAAVYNLVADMYEAAVTSATEQVRKVVEIVGQLEKDGVSPVTFTAVAQVSQQHVQAVKREVQRAIRNGWLINKEDRKNKPANLTTCEAEPLPERAGLPTPDELAGGRFTLSQAYREIKRHRHEGNGHNEQGFDWANGEQKNETVDEYWARIKAEHAAKRAAGN